MKKWMILLTALTFSIFLFSISSQAWAAPVEVEARAKTRTPGGLLQKTRTPRRQGKIHGPKVNLRGVIIAVGDSGLTLQQEDGTPVTIAVTSETKIQASRLGRTTNLADLQVGLKVNVQAVQEEDGSLTARHILLVPGKPVRAHHVGVVTDYQAGESITITDRWGESFTYLVNEQTKILPRHRADLLTVGARVTVIARRELTSLTPLALGIVIHPLTTETASPQLTPILEPTFTPTPTLEPTLTLTPEDTPTPTPEPLPTTNNPEE